MPSNLYTIENRREVESTYYIPVSRRKKRYNEIKKGIPQASEKMIIEKLKELELDGLISRKVYSVIPPHVEYELTKKGKTLAPILQAIADWGFAQMVD